NEQIGFAHFLQRGFEGFNQGMGQVAQKSHGIGKQNALFIGESETARRRIESGEKFIDCEDVSSGHQVQQRGFSGVGVTNDSCDCSICHRPSQLRARCAKISRMSWVRSRTLRDNRFSRLRPCAGESSSLKITAVTPWLCTDSLIASAFPLPM